MNQQSGNQQGVDQGRNQYLQNQNQQTRNQDNIGGLQGTSNKGSNSNENQNKKQHSLDEQTPIKHTNQLELNTTSQPASSNGRASDDELKHNKTPSKTHTEETNSSSSEIGEKKGKGYYKN